MAKKKLSEKQKAFCREYLVDFNGTQAAIRAGYSERTARTQAAQHLAKRNIQSYIKDLLENAAKKSELSVESVLADIAKIKSRCLQEEPMLDKEGQPTGEYKFNAQGALKACEMEGKYLSMFTDKLQHSGPEGKPIETEFIVNFVKSKKEVKK